MTPDSAIPSAGSAAPPPAPSTPSQPSNASVPAPGGQPPAPATPAPDGQPAVSTEPGAQPHPQSAEAQAQARYEAARQRLADARSKVAGGDARSENPDDLLEPASSEETPPPAADLALEGDQPAVAEPVGEVDFENLETYLTEEILRKRFHVPAKLAPELAAREVHRQHLAEGVRKLGGESGLKFSEAFNPILWKAEPTDEDAEAAFDALVLPEKGGGRKLVGKMANHFVTTALYDPEHGPGFASDLIREEWGTQPDGKTPYDLQFVDSIVKAHKSWGVGADGKPIGIDSLNRLVSSLAKHGIDVDRAEKLFRANKLGLVNNEYIDGELADQPEEPEHVPTEKEKEALARAEAAEAKLREQDASTEAKAAELKAEHERKVGLYRASATQWLQRYIFTKVMPAATKANWALRDGEEPTPGKQTLGRMTSTTINYEIQYGETKPKYDELMKMVDDGEAFDRSGKPTPRFLQVAEPLQNVALAMHNEFIRDLGPALKFTAASTRNARLVAERNGQQPESLEPPPLATPRPEKPVTELSTREALDRNFEAHRKRILAGQQRPGTLR